MKLIRRTYRNLTAAVMLVFALGALAPAGIAAAGIFCEMGPEAMPASAHACCEEHAMQDGEGPMPSHAPKTDDTACDMDAYCVTSVDKAVDKAPAVQQATGKVPAALLSGEIRMETPTDPVPAFLHSSYPVHIHSPPLFLLNASFLN